MLQDSVPSTQLPVTPHERNSGRTIPNRLFFWILATGYRVLVCCATSVTWGHDFVPAVGTNGAKTMHRWTAKVLLLVILVPAFGPLALARTPAPAAMHCMRQPLRQAAPAAQLAMHCHHGMGQAPPPDSHEASVRALDCCCSNHDCCRSLKTSERACPAANRLSFASLLIEPSLAAPIIHHVSANLIAPDSARAPPRR